MVYLGIQRPTVLRVLPSNSGVITYYFVGFGVTGMRFRGSSKANIRDPIFRGFSVYMGLP